MAEDSDTKPHRLTFSTNCIKKVLQKNEEVGKVKADSSAVIIKFMELLTNDILKKCDNVIQAKNAQLIESQTRSQFNVLPTNNVSNDSNTVKNKGVTAAATREQKKEQIQLQNLLTIDILHEAIQGDERLSFMDNIISNHFPEMDESALKRQRKAKRKQEREQKKAEKKCKRKAEKKKRSRKQLSEGDEERSAEDGDRADRNDRNTLPKKKRRRKPQMRNWRIADEEEENEEESGKHETESKQKFSFENVFGDEF